MPHQCTECGYTFPDGSKEMLAGCPECGGNTFQYHPDAVPDDPGDAPPPERDDAGVSGAVGRAAETVRDVFGGDRSADARSSPGQDPVTPNRAPAAEDESDPDAASGSRSPSSGSNSDSDSGPEDPAQADARSEVVDAADLPAPDTDADPDANEREAESGADAAPPPEGSGEVVSAPDESPPGLSDLREELNDQFESIRIVEPGQYELNLMELYDREEYIIALQENGRYVIEVPDAWRGDSEV